MIKTVRIENADARPAGLAVITQQKEYNELNNWTGQWITTGAHYLSSPCEIVSKTVSQDTRLIIEEAS